MRGVVAAPLRLRRPVRACCHPQRPTPSFSRGVGPKTGPLSGTIIALREGVHRLLALCAGFLAFAWTPSVLAAPPKLRVSVAPAAVVSGQVGPKLSVSGSLGLSVFTKDPAPLGSPVGLFASVGPRWSINRVLGIFGSYGYGWGRVPLEGSWDQEHRGTAGIYVGTPSDGALVGVSNRTRLDLRGVQRDEAWRFRVRARNETALVLNFKQWMQLSMPVELLISPQLSSADMMQLRAGVGLGGSAALGDAERAAARGRPVARIRWLAAARAGFWPVALFHGRDLPRADLSSTQGWIDLVITTGVGVSF